jgi:hypothetical protein
MSRLLVNLIALFFLFCLACQNPGSSTEKALPVNSEGRQVFTAIYGSPILDGSASDDIWEQCEWLEINQVWLGGDLAPEDFTGRYKLAWDENNLYVLAEITDDSLLDIHPEGLQQYWDDDCLEIFIDEDASGGNHQYNFNAFAYHIALDGQVSDIGPDSSFHFFNEHCLTRRLTRDHVSTWEIAVRIFDGNKYEMGQENVPKLLSQGKKMGFALAYCDNDRSAEREHFIGNVAIPGEDKNLGWIDADVFGLLELK